MDESGAASWRNLAYQAVQSPMKFITGWRASVCRGVCCPKHAHSGLEMVYHRKGAGVTRLGRTQTEVISFSEGSCVFYPPGLLHDQVMQVTGEDLCVHLEIPNSIVNGLQGCLVVPDVAHCVFTEWDHLTSGHRCDDVLEQGLMDLRATSALLAMLHQFFFSSGARNPVGKQAVGRAELYIREHFSTIASMREVAAYARLSPDRLRHLFKEQTGMSLVAYMTQVKIERAKSLLVHSIMPLKQIATLCGFRDEYYFSNVFRRKVGVAPGSYRIGAGSIASQ